MSKVHKSRLPRPGAFGPAPRGTSFRAAIRRTPKLSLLAVAAPAPAMPAPIDHGLTAAGIVAALGSAAFAAYMIAHNASIPDDAGLAGPASLSAAPPSMLQSSPENEREVFPAGIRAGSAPRERIVTLPGALASTPSLAGQGKDLLLLRFVHNGMALVESADGIYAVKKGSKLPGAGRVLSIGIHRGKWVLVTGTRIITASR